MAIEPASAKRRVGSYGFERFPAPVDVFSDEDEPARAQGQAAGSDNASSDKIIEHELVYPPKPFPGEELNHDWLAMMLNEQHEVHMRASTTLHKARKDVDSAAAELMKLKYEVSEERDAFRKMLEKLETIIGADELASLVELMERGIEHGSLNSSDCGSDAGDDGGAEQAAAEGGSLQLSDHEHEDGGQGETSNAATGAAGYDAEDEDESDDEPRLRTSDDVEGFWRMEELKRQDKDDEIPLCERYTAEEIWLLHNERRDADAENNQENHEDSGDNAERASEPSSSPVQISSGIAGAHSLFVPDPTSVLHKQYTGLHDPPQLSAPESRDDDISGRLYSSLKAASNDVQQDALSSKHGSPSSNAIDSDPQDTQQSPNSTSPAQERETSPDALSYTSGSDHGEKRAGQRDTVAPLLSPIHLSDPEPDGTPQVAVDASPLLPSNPRRSPSPFQGSPAPAGSSSPAPPSVVQQFEQVVLTVDIAEATAQTETITTLTSPERPVVTPSGDQPATATRPKSAESVEFISANFDTSQYRGPTTRKRGRATAGFEPANEAGPAKRVRNDGARSESPDKASVSADVAVAAPTSAPAATSASPTATQDEPPASVSASIFAPILSAFGISRGALSFNSRSNRKK